MKKIMIHTKKPYGLENTYKPIFEYTSLVISEKGTIYLENDAIKVRFLASQIYSYKLL